MNNRYLSKALNRQRGLSLVELLIAMALGLFLIWGVTQSFLTSRQSYRLQQGVGRIQENGRLAQEFLGFDIRNAGDYGCGSGDDFVIDAFDERNDAECTTATGGYGTAGVNMITATDFATTGFEYAVYGFNNDDGADDEVTDGTNTITLGAGKTPKANTDVLVLRLSEELGVTTASAGEILPAALASELSSVTIDKSVTLAATDVLAISDCATTKVLLANTTTNSTTVNLNTADNYCRYFGFQKGASVRRLNTVYYFVAASVSGTSFSLYRQVGDGADPEELLEGVEDMQLTFGLDTLNDGDGIIDSWDTADNVTAEMWNGWDWVDDPDGDPATEDGHKEYNLVRAVRYSLLLRTEDAVLEQEQTLSYNGASLYGGAATAGSGDRLLRQVFTGSVGIRSRMNPDS